MASCRICLDDLKKPVSLPCGHIFCSQCIVQTVQAVKPHTNLHPCPICRSLYNIAPINFNIVPPNLRPFVTPSIRKVYIDIPTDEATTETTTDAPTDPAVASESSSSELSRLRAENHTLRNNCAMWRRRAEMHGSANLGLLNFARVVRDQACLLARERDELQKHCNSLKRRLDEDESSFSQAHISGVQNTIGLDPDSLLFSTASPFFPDQFTSGQPRTGPENASMRVESPAGDLDRPSKRIKLDHHSPKVQVIQCAGPATSRVAARD